MSDYAALIRPTDLLCPGARRTPTGSCVAQARNPAQDRLFRPAVASRNLRL